MNNSENPNVNREREIFNIELFASLLAEVFSAAKKKEAVCGEPNLRPGKKVDREESHLSIPFNEDVMLEIQQLFYLTGYSYRVNARKASDKNDVPDADIVHVSLYPPVPSSQYDSNYRYHGSVRFYPSRDGRRCRSRDLEHIESLQDAQKINPDSIKVLARDFLLKAQQSIEQYIEGTKAVAPPENEVTKQRISGDELKFTQRMRKLLQMGDESQ